MVSDVLSYVLQCINTPFQWFNAILVSVGGLDLFLSVIAFMLFFRLILLPLVRGTMPLLGKGAAVETRNFINGKYSSSADYYGDLMK